MQRSLPPTILSLLSLFVLACPNAGPTQQPPDQVATSDAGGTSANVEQDSASGPDTTPPPQRSGPPLPSGPLCDSNADCGEGLVCEGVGCGTGQGRCVDSQRMCTRDLATYCGCDGNEFQSSGSCPGQRFAYRGPCKPALEDGEPCTDGQQCRSGMCVGDGLEGCGKGAMGECGSVMCTQDVATYCSCNNTEFEASGSCPNQQFAYRGPCEGG